MDTGDETGMSEAADAAMAQARVTDRRIGGTPLLMLLAGAGVVALAGAIMGFAIAMLGSRTHVTPASAPLGASTQAATAEATGSGDPRDAAEAGDATATDGAAPNAPTTAAGADATAPIDHSASEPTPAHRQARRLVDALAAPLDAEGTVAAMRATALETLRRDRPALALPLLTRAWFDAAHEPIRRDAVTAALWAVAPDTWLAPGPIGERTVAMLASAARDEQAWWRVGSDEDDMMRFLVRQVTLERERRERPVTERVRVMAELGSGRARFVAIAVLAAARDWHDSATIVNYLVPHMLDNDIARDAKFAATVLAEVAAHDPGPVRALVARPEPQLHDVALEALQLRTRPMSVPGSKAVAALPLAADREIDAVHGAWQPGPTSTLEPQVRQSLAFRSPAVPFAIGSTELVFLGDTPAPGTQPWEALQVIDGARRITLPVGRHVRPALPRHLGEAIELDRATIGGEFAQSIFRARDGSRIAAFRIDRGAADGMACDLLVIPIRGDRLLPGEARTFFDGHLEVGDDLRIAIASPRESGPGDRAAPVTRTWRWDGRGWVDVALERPDGAGAVPAGGGAAPPLPVG